jgi:opacity protein-like surface antigen
VNDVSRHDDHSTLACVSLGLLLMAASSAFATEITLGIDTAYIHESNFYRLPNDEVGADSAEVSGSITANREVGRLRYLASYTGSYQAYRDYDSANAPEHRLRLRGGFDINPRTTLHFNNRYRDVGNLRFSREDILDGDTGLTPNNDRYRRNDLELMLRRDLSRTWELELNATHQFIALDNPERSDSDSYEFGASVYHRFARRHRFGGGISYVSQNFKGAVSRLDAEAEYLLTNLAWTFDIADQVQLVVYGGPAFIRTDEDDPGQVSQQQFVGIVRGDEVFRANVNSCDFSEELGIGIASRCDFDTPGAEPIVADDLGASVVFPLEVGPSVGEDDDVVVFGGVALRATFSDWTVDAEIQRRPSAASGDSLAGSVTRFRWDVGYALGQSNWDIYFAGSLERREVITDSTRIDFTVIPGPENAAQRDVAFTRVRDPDDRRASFTGLVGLRKQFSRGFSVSASYRYRRTENRASAIDTVTDTSFLVIKATYEFNSFRL